MTDLFGPWDALLVLVVAAVFAVAIYWSRRADREELTTTEQMGRLFSAESRLKRRYAERDPKWQEKDFWSPR